MGLCFPDVDHENFELYSSVAFCSRAVRKTMQAYIRSYTKSDPTAETAAFLLPGRCSGLKRQTIRLPYVQLLQIGTETELYRSNGALRRLLGDDFERSALAVLPFR